MEETVRPEQEAHPPFAGTPPGTCAGGPAGVRDPLSALINGAEGFVTFRGLAAGAVGIRSAPAGTAGSAAFHLAESKVKRALFEGFKSVRRHSFPELK